MRSGAGWLASVTPAVVDEFLGGLSDEALLALPLYVPVLIFGAGSVARSAQGLDAEAQARLGRILRWRDLEARRSDTP